MTNPELYKARDDFEGGKGVYEQARFGRVITAMVTPFDEKSVNFDAAQGLARYLEQNGSEGLVVAGTTGESPVLSHGEQIELVTAVREAVQIPVIAGTGSNSTREAADLSLEVTDRQIADGLLVVSPYYNRPPQSGIEHYYKEVASYTDLPVIMYNIPVRTGRGMAWETIANLVMGVDNIVGLKDAAGNVDETAFLAHSVLKNQDFEVYSGDDALNMALWKKGAAGAISVASHWAGREMQEMYDALDKGDEEKAIKANRILEESYAFESSEDTPNPIPTKAMMRLILGQTIGYCRPPLVVSEKTQRELEQTAKEVYRTLKAA